MLTRIQAGPPPRYPRYSTKSEWQVRPSETTEAVVLGLLGLGQIEARDPLADGATEVGGHCANQARYF
jgi:hypothetical protein